MRFESLLFILALVAMVFINVLQPWLRRQAELARRGRPGAEPVQALPGDATDEDLPPAETPAPIGPAPAALPVVQTEGPRRPRSPAPLAVAHGAQASQGHVLHAPPTSLAEARRGIVLRTMLGPCRAHEPFDGSVT